MSVTTRWTPRYALGIALVAVIATGFAIAFRWTLAWTWELAAGAHDVVAAMELAPWWACVLLPAAGGLAAGILVLLAARHTTGGSGVGGVIEAVAIGRIRLSFRAALLRAASSWCAIVTGGSLGREGPLIQFGGTTGDDVGEWLKLGTHERRVLIAAGTAAGFAAAYNTPLAAVVFVLEVVVGVIVMETVVPTLIATVIATAMSRWLVGEGPIYGQRMFVLADLRELIAYAALGAVCALVAWAFTRLVQYAARLFKRIPSPWRQAAGGLGAGAIVAAMPSVAGNGYEPLGAILDHSLTLAFVGWLLLAKMVATASSVAAGNPGGVFTPSMLIGGCVGYLFGNGLDALGFAVSSPGGYALVGMAAAVAATTHAPLMAAVLAFEVSGDYAVVLPLVLATAVATGLARRLDRDSVYTAELRERGVTWELTRTLPTSGS
ncbi:MAG: chloride channel protein [Deltaproteobacteria bacterium]|nr:chloride channel protein [Deltaproteobacteria bacterium]